MVLQPIAGSIWAPAGTGYRCPMTDAYVYDPANCTSANLGGTPEYDDWFPGGQDLSNIPYADGGTCPAYKCGYGKGIDADAVNAEKQAAHTWWGNCISANTAEYCRTNDPWQQ